MNKLFFISLCIFATLGTAKNTQASAVDQPRAVDDSALVRIAGSPIASFKGKTKELPYPEESIGNIYSVYKGELFSNSPIDKNFENNVIGVHNHFITSTLHLQSSIDILHEFGILYNYNNIIFRAPQELSFTATKFIDAKSCVFASNRIIKFRAVSLTFYNCFLEVEPGETIIEIYPHVAANSPIEVIRFTPTKKIVAIQGMIDFTNGNFKKFIISESNARIHFK